MAGGAVLCPAEDEHVASSRGEVLAALLIRAALESTLQVRFIQDTFSDGLDQLQAEDDEGSFSSWHRLLPPTVELPAFLDAASAERAQAYDYTFGPGSKEKVDFVRGDEASFAPFAGQKSLACLCLTPSTSAEVCSRMSFPRYRVALLVPFRDRGHNVAPFLAYMHAFLRRKCIQFRIYFISQVRLSRISNIMLSIPK